MIEMDRRTLMALLASGMAASGAQAMTPRTRPMRVMLLGQSLIQQDVCASPWPGRAAIAERLRRCDVVFTDLETAIRAPGAGAPTRTGEVLHTAPPAVLDCLKALGVTMVTTANNHAWDLGSGGILAALRELDRRGIVHAGSGPDLAAAAAAAVQSTPAGRFALVAAAAGAIRDGAAATPARPGVNELRRRADGTLEPEDVARVVGAIRAARAGGATVLMCLHNHYWEPQPSAVPAWQQALARGCIDAGAAAFVGHGPPMLQATDYYRGAPLFHGLGNFIFQTRKVDGAYADETWRSLMVEARFADGRFVDATIRPLSLRRERRGEFTEGVPALDAPAWRRATAPP